MDLYDETLRKAVALFVSIMHLRHPRSLSMVKEVQAKLVALFESLSKDGAGDPVADLVDHHGFAHPRDSSQWEEYRNAGTEQVSKTFIDVIEGNATSCAELLMKKRWFVVFSEEPVFITTDAPVVVLNPQREVFGLATPGTIVSFPLSPSRVLIMDDMHEEPRGQYYPAACIDPAAVNLIAWSNCERFMISHRHTDLVCAELIALVDRRKRI